MKKINSIFLLFAICGSLTTISHAYTEDQNLTQNNTNEASYYSIEYDKDSGELYLSSIEDDSITINSIESYDEENGLATVSLTKKTTINGNTYSFLDSIDHKGDIILNIKVTNYSTLSKTPNVFLDLFIINNTYGTKALLYSLIEGNGYASLGFESRNETSKISAYLHNTSSLLFPAQIEYELYGLYYMSLFDYEDYINETNEA